SCGCGGSRRAADRGASFQRAQFSRTSWKLVPHRFQRVFLFGKDRAMKKGLLVPLCALAVVAGLVGAGAVATLRTAHAEEAKKKAEAAPDLKLAASRIAHVTVYQNNALVTREVDVPEGTGTLELVVSPL